ncbi:LuxR C-terminal-related transcriptional regulator [Oceanibaculum pacificum]|nr:response regulator transcription factor [Oceanibaculum pacificum]
MLKLMLLESNKLFREGLKRLLYESGFDVCVEESTLAGALDGLVINENLDLLLFDPCELPGQSDGESSELYLQLRRAAPNTKLVVLTTRICPQVFGTALESGVDGFLLKNMSADALVRSLQLVMIGEKVFPTTLAAVLVSGGFGAISAARTAHSMKGLSDREIQILQCLLNGYPNKLIANELHITEGTVKVHLKGILSKINARNRTQAAIWAMNNGLGASPSPSA